MKIITRHKKEKQDRNYGKKETKINEPEKAEGPYEKLETFMMKCSLLSSC